MTNTAPILQHKQALLRRALILVLTGLSALAGEGSAQAADPHRTRREEMVTTQLIDRGITHQPTLEAFSRVPRHRFVRQEHLQRAYDDRPLPIGHGQTISQPYIVALMTELIEPEPGHRILEIGTGSGYQAAILAEITDHVYTIEIVEALAEWGAGNLRNAGYHQVKTARGDGYYGWDEAAPFDSIVVTAAAASIPPPLLSQLAPGGTMIIPVGSPFRTQVLTLVHREGEAFRTEQILPVRFVPFVRPE
ncbi:protein-L-isoaspartate(D-aspartate) O-methyltransferase [Alkalispirochaeta americana]|uniref:Protein-L-isoaspartate O-methyltransferase n=1 Tax=Alkalispirochaeta americana TaxID=159291 RepID=A0A1N6PTW0_9SPIO|nr:protein-L-isoaspartate(D-aspartate) O-methyltransferase [Alkalispirochaeta americana]SIQ07746.1 protein-L-isoaspartate(D-aspartate) O-methyltransferase [Alkalispirochaeta americana]